MDADGRLWRPDVKPRHILTAKVQSEICGFIHASERLGALPEGAVLQLKDGASRGVLFSTGQDPDVRPRRRNWSLLGFPMFCSEKLPPLGTKGDLILIDPRDYLIGDRTQATIAASDHVNFLKNHVTFRVTRRTDGQTWIEKPITCKTGPRLSGRSWC